MSKQKDLNEKAKDYLDAHKVKQKANDELNAAHRAMETATRSVEVAEDAITDCVGDNIRRRAFHIDGNTVLVEYDPNHDKAKVSVLNEDGEVRI